jgi:hypothetical protein
MAKNCSADVQAVIAHVDQVLGTGTPEDIHSLMATFGMEDLTHVDDFAGACMHSFPDLVVVRGTDSTFPGSTKSPLGVAELATHH